MPLALQRDDLDEAQAERVLHRAIKWGRYTKCSSTTSTPG